MYSLYSNNIELIDVNSVNEQEKQFFPKEFLRSMWTSWQTHTHLFTHWPKKYSKERLIPVQWVFYCSLYKSYMLQIYFIKPTRTLQRHPFLIFLLKILKDCDNLISLGTRSQMFGPRNEMDSVPCLTEFTLCFCNVSFRWKLYGAWDGHKYII